MNLRTLNKLIAISHDSVRVDTEGCVWYRRLRSSPALIYGHYHFIPKHRMINLIFECKLASAVNGELLVDVSTLGYEKMQKIRIAVNPNYYYRELIFLLENLSIVDSVESGVGGIIVTLKHATGNVK